MKKEKKCWQYGIICHSDFGSGWEVNWFQPCESKAEAEKMCKTLRSHNDLSVNIFYVGDSIEYQKIREEEWED